MSPVPKRIHPGETVSSSGIPQTTDSFFRRSTPPRTSLRIICEPTTGTQIRGNGNRRMRTWDRIGRNQMRSNALNGWRASFCPPPCLFWAISGSDAEMDTQAVWKSLLVRRNSVSRCEANQAMLMLLLKAKPCTTSGSQSPFPTQSLALRGLDAHFSRIYALPHVRLLHIH